MRTAISRGQGQRGKAVAVGAWTGKTCVPKAPYCRGECNPRPGHYLTHAPGHITRAVEAMDSCFALTWAHQHGRAVGQCPGKIRVCFFSYFGGPRGAVWCPKAMKTKGTKRSDKKKNKTKQNKTKKTRVTYRVKRMPKWKRAPPYGVSPPTSPGNRTPPPD